MSDINELDNLIDKFKSESYSSKDAAEFDPQRTEKGPLLGMRSRTRASPLRFSKPERGERRFEPSACPDRIGTFATGERRETVILGLLASVITAGLGIAASTDYLVLIGGVSFLLFSFIMFMLMFSDIFHARKNPAAGGASAEPALLKRIEKLSDEIEILKIQKQAPFPAIYEPGGREIELERKIEELRNIIKSVAQSLGKQ
ncbi:MAG: hypothetical protein HY746_08605 [Elusimicrobia bacterium]|nr:hypothetical protein [Elusimicrobiota bacterium]